MDQHEDTLTWGVNPFYEILSALLRVSSLHNNLGTEKEKMGCMPIPSLPDALMTLLICQRLEGSQEVDTQVGLARGPF